MGTHIIKYDFNSGVLCYLGKFIIENKALTDKFFVKTSEMRGKTFGFLNSCREIFTFDEFKNFCTGSLKSRTNTSDNG